MPQRSGPYITPMRPPYPIVVTVDGKRYAGDWYICQGGRVCVRWALGSQMAELGRDKPETVAAKTLERMVRADQKSRAAWKLHQQREAERLSKPRRSRKAKPSEPDLGGAI